ncbi:MULTISPECIES: autotransporter domain-containing protein [unclassified Pseudomonas]|uniref:autotransporter domain-containing protein n=1 Tax=unclassified Pseudomonas TaxID=196821 RepID=UPI00385D4D8D
MYVEPQLQPFYSYVDLDSSDDVGAKVRFKDVDSLIGRPGVRIAKDWATEGVNKSEQPTNGWIRPSVWHEFKGNRRPISLLSRVTFRSNRTFREPRARSIGHSAARDGDRAVSVT